MRRTTRDIHEGLTGSAGRFLGAMYISDKINQRIDNAVLHHKYRKMMKKQGTQRPTVQKPQMNEGALGIAAKKSFILSRKVLRRLQGFATQSLPAYGETAVERLSQQPGVRDYTGRKYKNAREKTKKRVKTYQEKVRSMRQRNEEYEPIPLSEGIKGAAIKMVAKYGEKALQAIKGSKIAGKVVSTGQKIRQNKLAQKAIAAGQHVKQSKVVQKAAQSKIGQKTIGAAKSVNKEKTIKGGKKFGKEVAGWVALDQVSRRISDKLSKNVTHTSVNDPTDPTNPENLKRAGIEPKPVSPTASSAQVAVMRSGGKG